MQSARGYGTREVYHPLACLPDTSAHVAVHRHAPHKGIMTGNIWHWYNSKRTSEGVSEWVGGYPDRYAKLMKKRANT